jgi:hypothetical protein
LGCRDRCLVDKKPLIEGCIANVNRARDPTDPSVDIAKDADQRF